MDREKEREIIEKVLQGKTAYFEELVDSSKRQIFSLLYRMSLDPGVAEEIAQDSFLKAYQNLATFKGESSFSTWVYQIAYRKALDFLRKKKPVQMEVEHIPEMDESQPLSNYDWVEPLLKQMTEKDRALLHLFYFEDMSLKEMSEILKMSISALKVALMRSRKKFKKLAEPWMEKTNSEMHL